MKIAQVAPLTEAVPPKLYGGTERVVAYLTDALVELGHEVTLFASGDSETKAHLAPIWPKALRLDPNVRDPFVPMFMQLETVARRAHEFDVIHCHLDYFGYHRLYEGSEEYKAGKGSSSTCAAFPTRIMSSSS